VPPDRFSYHETIARSLPDGRTARRSPRECISAHSGIRKPARTQTHGGRVVVLPARPSWSTRRRPAFSCRRAWGALLLKSGSQEMQKTGPRLNRNGVAHRHQKAVCSPPARTGFLFIASKNRTGPAGAARFPQQFATAALMWLWPLKLETHRAPQDLEPLGSVPE
jgi:hypothetical protein